MKIIVADKFSSRVVAMHRTHASCKLNGELRVNTITSSSSTLTCDGVLLPTTGKICVANGSVSSPSVYLINAPSSGLYLSGGSSFAISVLGNPTFVLSSTTASLDAALSVTVQASTASASTTEGALVVAGGCGVAKNCFVGGNVSLAQSISQTTLSGNTATPTFRFLGDTTTGIYQPTSDSVGVMTNGGAKFTIADSSITMAAAVTTTTVNNTTQSSGKTSGSIVVAGGMTVGGNMYIGGNVVADSLGGSSLASTTDGSASAPAYSFSNNTQTGMYRPNGSSSGINFTSNGTQVFAISSNSSNVCRLDIGSNVMNGAGGVAIGYSAYTTSGNSESIAVGYNAAASSAYCIAIGYNTNASQAGSVAIGFDARCIGSYWGIAVGHSTRAADQSITIGNGSFNYGSRYVCFQYSTSLGTYARFNSASWYGFSDESLKTDISDLELGMDFLREARPITYRRRDDEGTRLAEYSELIHYGFSYQRLRAALDKCGVTGKHLSVDWMFDQGHVSPEGLMPNIIRAVRELKERSDAQQKRIDTHRQ